MQWLKEYEGPRGIAYLIAASAMLAPSVVAMYLLEPALLRALDWPRTLLLCASAGIMSSTIGVVGCFFFGIPDDTHHGPKANPSEAQIRKTYRLSLIFGFIVAFVCQGLALAHATRHGLAFRDFVSHEITWTLVGAGSLVAVDLLRSLARRSSVKA